MKQGGTTVVLPAMTVAQQARYEEKRRKALASRKKQAATTLPSPSITAEQRARSKVNRLFALEGKKNKSESN